MTFKTGKLPVKHDERTLYGDKYFGAVSPPPAVVDWQSNPNLTFNMFKNDSLGDCTCATTGHCTQRWTYDENGTEITLTDDDIVVAYSAVSGYDPATGANDNGAAELDVLNYWRNTGVGGHKIAAFVKLNVKNLDQIKQAVNLFGSVYIGIEFPDFAMDQFNNGQPWDVEPNAPAPTDGHAISIGAYDSDGFEVVTWAKRQKMTYAFFDKYCDEAYAVLGNDWFNGGKDPQGFDVTTLQTDLTAIGNNQPTPQPEPIPTPEPAPPTPTPEPTPEPVPPFLDANQTLAVAARTWLGHRHETKVNTDFVAAVQAWLDTNPS